MPELPEVEITARRLSAALDGAEVESALAPGMVALKSVDPPLEAIVGRTVSRVRRVAKMPVVEFETTGDGTAPLAMLVHLMSAGRLQVFDKRASLRDRASRVLVRLADGRELRLREFGTKQRAWAKLMPADAVEADEMVATLGPEAWPAPSLSELARQIAQPRHLHPMLRDQRVVAGIGRSWVDEILWEAGLSPFKQGSELEPEEIERLHAALHVLGDAIDSLRGGDRRHGAGQAADAPPGAPSRGRTLPALRRDDRRRPLRRAHHVLLPRGADGGRVLKDRRLSRLLEVGLCRNASSGGSVAFKATEVPLDQQPSRTGLRAVRSYRRRIWRVMARPTVTG